MNKLWHDEAWEDYVYWQTQDKKYLKKINRLLKPLCTLLELRELLSIWLYLR